MALAPLRNCTGCRKLHRGANPCDDCRRKRNRQYAKQRKQDTFYRCAPWRKLRAAYLAKHPLCAECERKGRITPASEVHHKKPRQTHPELAYDWDNLAGLCKPCHSAETRREQRK